MCRRRCLCRGHALGHERTSTREEKEKKKKKKRGEMNRSKMDLYFCISFPFSSLAPRKSVSFSPHPPPPPPPHLPLYLRTLCLSAAICHSLKSTMNLAKKASMWKTGLDPCAILCSNSAADLATLALSGSSAASVVGPD